jgi:hypothetical protein
MSYHLAIFKARLAAAYGQQRTRADKAGQYAIRIVHKGRDPRLRER